MDFFNNKIKKYQEKKLDEILFKIQFHQSTKKELEEKMDKRIKLALENPLGAM